jgi:hypothetical protein
MTYSTASLAGPALAALIAAGFGARLAVIAAAVLVALAVPAACSLRKYRKVQDRITAMAPHRQIAAGFAVIVTRRPLLRATVTSVVSYVGIGMLIVCCPVLGAQRLGGAARGAVGDRLPARRGRDRGVRRGRLPARAAAKGPAR